MEALYRFLLQPSLGAVLSGQESRDHTVLLTDKFGYAVLYALKAHKEQTRKSSGAPYSAHLLGVASTILEFGGTEEEAIAGLLHDCVEDQGGLERLAEIEKEFGENVAKIVRACSDAFEIPKPPWKERKVKHIEEIRHASLSVLLVTVADKLYNGRMTLDDLRYQREKVWEKFKGGKEGTLWYYKEMTAAIWKRCADFGLQAYWVLRLVEELRRTVEAMEEQAEVIETCNNWMTNERNDA